MTQLNDADIEAELERIFGLPDDPDVSEDEYEGEDGEEGNFNLQTLLEDRVQVSPTPGPSNRSPLMEHRVESSPTPGPSGRSPQFLPIIEEEEVNDNQINCDLSEESSSGEEDENGWSKQLWSHRPSPDTYDQLPLKPRVFYPSRTSPQAYFTRYFTDEVLQHIIEQTNLYASQKQTPNWEPVIRPEMDAFLGIIILMGLHVLPSIDLYWSSDPFFRVDEIAQVMTCKRFKKILQNLHLNDNTKIPSKTSPNYDKLYKVRPVLDLLNHACKNEAKPSSSQSIDEAMIRFKGISALKQYMPAKPIKRGFKVWVRSDSTTGYVFEYEIYTGKNDNNTPELGLGANVVKNLSQKLIDEKVPAHLAFDNFFASFPLMQYLYENGIHSTATVNINRADLPKFVKEQKQKGKKLKLERGDYKWRVKKDVGFAFWKDTKNVTVMSTAFHPKNKTMCQRTMKDGKKKEFPCPLAITEYTKRMGGVDRFDQKRGTYEIGRRSRRWWLRIFYFLMDLAITNAYILYTVSPRNVFPLSLLLFRLSIGRALIGNYTSRKRSLSSEPNYICKKKKANVSDNYQKVIGVDETVRYNNVGQHLIDKADTPRRCRLCSTKTNNVRTKLSCTTCKVFLCAYPCFTQFHQKP